MMPPDDETPILLLVCALQFPAWTGERKSTNLFWSNTSPLLSLRCVTTNYVTLLKIRIAVLQAWGLILCL